MTVVVVMKDFSFNPTFIKVARGASVKLQLKNAGISLHNFSSKTLHADLDLRPGEHGDLTFTIPASGVPEFFCKYHKENGMQGALYF
ncbi:MAG: hypothetical protein NVSMB57_16710 [Actinomycetota bacterium]